MEEGPAVPFPRDSARAQHRPCVLCALLQRMVGETRLSPSLPILLGFWVQPGDCLPVVSVAGGMDHAGILPFERCVEQRDESVR